MTVSAFTKPSYLPGWSRAHVVAHVARNADALLNAVPAVVQRWIDAVASGRHPAPPALRLLQVGGARRAPEGARRAEPVLGGTLQQVLGRQRAC
ncbi:maleylpyruvate isomerase N-terminal domain-containing protein [Streptomyces sp. NBC_01604]|nr:maleylpyruvate isomerase N-terminal domain-containing protein [Streptomyces sp. NBC_01373]